MKGFTKDGKFHPIKPYNKVRKARDTTKKTQGLRLKRKISPRIAFRVLDKTEEQLYRLRDELSDQMEQETWLEVNRLIDKIQDYKLKYYGGTGKVFDTERKRRDDPPVPFVTGRARTEILKNFWLDKLTHDQQTREFEQYKKDQIRIGYQPYQGDLADWREHQIYIISAFGE